MKRRWLAYGAAILALAGLLTISDPPRHTGVAAAIAVSTKEPVPDRAPIVAATSGRLGGKPPALLLELIAREELIAPAGQRIHGNAFATHSWLPPPKPVTPPLVAPSPAPTAPLLAFTYAGKKLEAGVWEVYLTRGEQSFILREGQVIEGTYRVTSIAPPHLTLTYLPLNQSQTLSIGSAPQ